MLFIFYLFQRNRNKANKWLKKQVGLLFIDIPPRKNTAKTPDLLKSSRRHRNHNKQNVFKSAVMQHQ
jgi:hypothetical protein